MSTKQEDKTIRRYSDAFKRQVVERIEEDGYTHGQAAELYGCARSSIHRWLKAYGKNHLLNKVVRIQTMNETDHLKQLKQENHRLKEALANSYMDHQLTRAHLDIACKRLGMDSETFKKKHDPRLSPKVTKKHNGQ